MEDMKLILEHIKEDLEFIKENMLDKDMVLSEDDLEALSETAKEKKSGKLINLEDIEKELGCR